MKEFKKIHPKTIVITMTAFGKMSSRKYLSNANKLQEMVIAYNLNNPSTRLCFSKNIKENRIETLRMKIIKVAAKVIESKPMGNIINFRG